MFDVLLDPTYDGDKLHFELNYPAGKEEPSEEDLVSIKKEVERAYKIWTEQGKTEKRYKINRELYLDILYGYIVLYLIRRKGDKFVQSCITQDAPDVIMTLEEYVATLEVSNTVN